VRVVLVVIFTTSTAHSTFLTLSLHDALPISVSTVGNWICPRRPSGHLKSTAIPTRRSFNIRAAQERKSLPNTVTSIGMTEALHSTQGILPSMRETPLPLPTPI